jgi:hypothetical protein
MDERRDALAAAAVDAGVVLAPGDDAILLAGSPAALTRLRSYVGETSGGAGGSSNRLANVLDVVNEPKR